MELKHYMRPLFKETMEEMPEGETFAVSAMKENSVRSVACNLRKLGYDFDITRKGDIMEVVCIKRPGSEEGAR